MSFFIFIPLTILNEKYLQIHFYSSSTILFQNYLKSYQPNYTTAELKFGIPKLYPNRMIYISQLALSEYKMNPLRVSAQIAQGKLTPPASFFTAESKTLPSLPTAPPMHYTKGPPKFEVQTLRSKLR
jgi:hypothetical protein